MNIAREDVLVRRSLISQTLVDEIYSGTNDQVLLQLQETYQFSDTVLFAIEKKYQYVLLGFLRTKDLFEELVQEVKLDSKTALAVYQALDEKIFSRLRGEIENTYKLFQTNNTPEQVVSPIQTKEQVVLRKETSPETVALSFKDVPTPTPLPQENPVPRVVQQPTPISLKTSPASSFNQPVGIAPNNTPAPAPVSLESTTQKVVPLSPPVPPYAPKTNTVPSAQVPVQNVGEQKISQAMFAVPHTAPSTDGPMVLHKKEEISSVGQSTAGKAYRQMSFGSFMGAFKSPQNKETNISRAEIEMPTVNQSSGGLASSQQVPFSVKKYDSPSPASQSGEQVKVVHYSEKDIPQK